MDIIFVRHGEAEKADTGMDDSERRLTQKGEHDIKKTAVMIKKHVKTGNEIYIWSSPAVRAIQTARILADELEITTISSFDFIWNGDYSGFSMETGNYGGNTTLIVTGHEPHLSNWSEMLQGARIEFDKGTAAGFGIQNMSPLEGTFLWVVQPDTDTEENKDDGDTLLQNGKRQAEGKKKSSGLKKKSKSEREKKRRITRNEYSNILESNMQDIAARKESFLKDPDDIEQVHQFRVKIRHLRSLVSFIKPMLDEQLYAGIQEKLKSSAQRFSYIREIDVLAKGWAALRWENPDLFMDSDSLTGVLKGEREKEKNTLFVFLSEGGFDAELQEAFNGIRASTVYGEAAAGRIGDSMRDPVFEEFTEARFAQWRKKVEKEMKILDFSSQIELHALRISFKKLRYVNDSLMPYKRGGKWGLSEFEVMQDNLGDICDIYRNVAVLQKLKSIADIPNLQYEAGIYIGHQIHHKERLLKKLKKTLK